MTKQNLRQHHHQKEDPERLLRVDHFSGKGATLINGKVVKQILTDYKVFMHKEPPPVLPLPANKTPMVSFKEFFAIIK